MARDQNGRPLHKKIMQASHPDGRHGWAVTVWFGDNPATTIRRYVYETRAQAERGDISHEPGKHGCIDYIGFNSGWRQS